MTSQECMLFDPGKKRVQKEHVVRVKDKVVKEDPLVAKDNRRKADPGFFQSKKAAKVA